MANDEVAEISITQSYSDNERASVHFGTGSYELPQGVAESRFLIAPLSFELLGYSAFSSLFPLDGGPLFEAT
jgi:hypothetical protein